MGVGGVMQGGLGEEEVGKLQLECNRWEKNKEKRRVMVIVSLRSLRAQYLPVVALRGCYILSSPHNVPAGSCKHLYLQLKTLSPQEFGQCMP